MNAPGVLLDSGPLVALLSKHDERHQDALALFADCQAPFSTCEAVIAEACFLMRQVAADAPAEIVALGRRGLYRFATRIDDDWAAIEALLKKYRDRPISLAEAGLIRCAECTDEPRILTFDASFDGYRWGRQRRFQRVAV